MARQERAVRTRRTVLEAAAAVFDERGYKAATIADILKRADVTKGALYFHFASKRALAQGILDEQFSQAEVPHASTACRNSSTPACSSRTACATTPSSAPEPDSHSAPT
ncbi:TetR family transcriptional regulator [Streptomyces sp. bgisy060]|uniref:TetR family transcriptional regulator n=1 Tax=Streptomyces sp. bgisy060 TaxID=3413775 RepID=UPI003EBD7A6C